MSTFLEAVGIAGIVLLVLIAAGFATTQILVPRGYRRYVLLLSPFVGYGILSGIGHYLGWLGLSTNQFGTPLVVGLAICSISVWFRFRRSCVADSGGVGTWAVVVIVFMVCVIPVVHAGILTTIGKTIDGISYVCRAELIQNQSLTIPVVDRERPVTAWTVAPMKANLRMGDVYLLAIVCSLTGQRAYELFTVISLVFFALIAPAVFLFCRVTLRLRGPPSIVAAVLVASSNLLLWAVYDNFLSQVVGTSLVPVTTAIGIAALQSRRTGTIILAGLFFSALISTYVVYAVVVLGAVALASFLSGLQDRSRLVSLVGKTVAGVVCILTAAFFANGVGVIRAARELWFLLHVDVAAGGGGNIRVFPHPGEIFGLVNHPNQAFGLGFPELPSFLIAFLFGFLIALTAIGGCVVQRKRRVIGVTVLGTAIVFVLSQRWVVDFPRGFPYGYFKSLSLLVVFAMPMLGNGIARIPARLVATRGSKRLLWVGVSVCTVIAVSLGFLNTALTVNHAARNLVVMSQAIAEIGDGMLSVERDSLVVVSVSPGIRQNWIGYLLRDYRVLFKPSLAHYPIVVRNRNSANAGYALVSRQLATSSNNDPVDLSSIGRASWMTFWENGEYMLRRRINGVIGECRASEAIPLTIKQNEKLRIETSDGMMTVNVGSGTTQHRFLSGQPKTIRIVIANPADSTRLRIAGRAYGLGGGLSEIVIPGWQPTSRTDIESEGVADLHVLSVSASRVNEHGSTRVVGAQIGGVVFSSLEVFGSQIKVVSEIFINSTGQDINPYRMGLHITSDVSAENPFFGAWGVDFERKQGRQTAILTLDLETRIGKALLDGRVVPIIGGARAASQGGFFGQVVLWNLNDTSTFVDARTVVRFEEVGEEIRDVVFEPSVFPIIFY